MRSRVLVTEDLELVWAVFLGLDSMKEGACRKDVGLGEVLVHLSVCCVVLECLRLLWLVKNLCLAGRLGQFTASCNCWIALFHTSQEFIRLC